MVAGSYYKPKDGSDADGEDSHFLELPALGVADGVDATPARSDPGEF